MVPATIVPAIIPLDQIHEGMRGTALTVFQGVKPESMDVEVLGVMHNANGPKGDIILVRLHGNKPEYTGVVAGMSGSPVYFNGKLAGALAFRIGEFSKEPIAGVTPIEEMLAISALDRRPAPMPVRASLSEANPNLSEANPDQGGVTQTASPGEGPAVRAPNYSNYLKPIETPLVFNGFSDETLQRYGSQFAAAGIVPVMGIGSASDGKQPEPIEAGSAVSAVLVRGDMDIAATCTVTYVDPQRLLACGHPLLQFGEVDLPMTKATVLATLPSPLNAFKIVNTTETIGAFVQDRQNGIMGVPGQESKMIPVTVTMHVQGERASGGHAPKEQSTATKEFHYEILNNARLSPLAMMATVFNALKSTNEYAEDITYRMNGVLSVKGYPDVTLRDMFAPQDNGQPAAALAAATIGDRFGRIYSNPLEAPDVQGVKLDFDLVRERRSARLEAARTDMTEARPGDQIVVETVIRPYRGERLLRQIPIRIPTSTSKGTLRILVSDGDTLDRVHRATPMMNRSLGLAPTIALLNKERANDRVYVSLIGSDPEAMVADKVMPTLPLSVMNVMDNMRGTQDMVVIGESSVSEASTEPLDYVVSGAQMLTINIK